MLLLTPSLDIRCSIFAAFALYSRGSSMPVSAQPSTDLQSSFKHDHYNLLVW